MENWNFLAFFKHFMPSRLGAYLIFNNYLFNYLKTLKLSIFNTTTVKSYNNLRKFKKIYYTTIV